MKSRSRIPTGFWPARKAKITSDEFAEQLSASNYTKFGCETKDAQAAGLLFGFPPEPGQDGLYQGDKIVALRSWIGESGKVFKVEVFFQPGLVVDVAKPNLMWCGRGLHVAGKSEPDKP